MLNKRPIFFNAFAYGGSNILLNLLRSHPDICSPRGELNEVFKGKLDESVSTRVMKCLRYIPLVLAEGRDVFKFNDWKPRKSFKASTSARVDRILFDEKLRAREEGQNLYKSENVKYSDEEIKQSRLLCKNLDGLIFLYDNFREMYPDATFIALIRNGFAVAEGHLRRGYDFEVFVKNYELGCMKMINDAEKDKNYHIFKYEDILENPYESLLKIYSAADLDLDRVKKIRLETKKVILQDGSHQHIHGTDKKQLKWYDLDKFGAHFQKNANENQIKRLSESQKDFIKKNCPQSLKHFNYVS